MLAVLQICSASLHDPCALWYRPEECNLCRWFELQVVAHTGCQKRGATKRIGRRKCRIALNRSVDGHEC